MNVIIDISWIYRQQDVVRVKLIRINDKVDPNVRASRKDYEAANF